MKPYILIVDDEIEITSSLSRDFRFDGFEVSVAHNGLEALEVLKKQRVDILISDIMMPEMNGIELLKNVRKDYPMIQVIMMTGYVRLSLALECMQNQARTIIFKPFHDLDEMKRAVEEGMAYISNWQKKLAMLQNLKTE